MKFFRFITAVFVAAVLSFPASALDLPYIMSDGMVLQQKSKVNIYGTATPGSKITVAPSWTGRKYSGRVAGNGRWIVAIPTPAGSYEEYEIRITDSRNGSRTIKNVLVGEVWMTAGQSNMQHPMRGFNGKPPSPVKDAEAELADANLPAFRYFKVPYQLSSEPLYNTKEAEWVACDSTNAREFQAMAFFLGREVQRKIDMPLGIIGCAYGGTRIESWMPKESFSKFADDDYKTAEEVGPKNPKSFPSNVYNGMVRPLLDYTFRGWLWYQGESNRDNAHAYARLQAEMVRSWRAYKGDKKNSLLFYFMQIAPFKSADSRSAADLRAAQAASLALIPNSGMSSAGDVADYGNVHYPNKKVPALRLALWPLYYQYGFKEVNPMGPAFKSMKAEGNRIIVSLSNAEGLHYAEGVENAPFAQLAGADGVFVDAAVKFLSDNTLEFSAPSVAEPRAVKYCYFSWHVATILNGEGLPLFPFEESL